ncbi:hypothetical protein B296_00057121 [Ensete ventricosum]|uniref:Uncharacterized protein n=1 Tax=Ensete ventricosum TaxID=4639 RepID=A0A426WYA6_ENSVE|nr:hypothetical protein B296_00057121 [Ensete ventricosum]
MTYRKNAGGYRIGRMHRDLAKVIESSPGWRKRVRQKKTETCRKMVVDDGPGSSLSIEPGFERYSGISLEFARRFTEGIRKLAGSTLGDYQKKII